MDILLIVATLAVAAAGLYVAATFNRRTRQNTAPLIDGAAKDISEQIENTNAELRRQLKTIAVELQRDRDQIRLDGRKVQGRLDHADSRMTSIANQLLAELETVRRLGERLSARQDQLTEHLRYLTEGPDGLAVAPEGPSVAPEGPARSPEALAGPLERPAVSPERPTGPPERPTGPPERPAVPSEGPAVPPPSGWWDPPPPADPAGPAV
jgi:hypothetical protein